MAGATTHGILYAAFGIVDDKGDILKDAKKGVSELGVEVVDGEGEGATTANITNTFFSIFENIAFIVNNSKCCV